MQVYVFKETGVIQDNYVIRSSVALAGKTMSSVGDSDGRASIGASFNEGLRASAPSMNGRPSMINNQ
jgi:hypothetical protein